MLTNLLALGTFAVMLSAMVFLLIGHFVVMRLPTVRNLHRVRQALSRTQLSHSIRKGTSLIQITRRLLADLVDTTTSEPPTCDFANRSVGDVIQIVYYRDRSLRWIIKELRFYAFLLSLLGVIGFLRELAEADFSLAQFWTLTGKNPLDVIDLFEAVMVLLFAFRLVVELSAIRELLED